MQYRNLIPAPDGWRAVFIVLMTEVGKEHPCACQLYLEPVVALCIVGEGNESMIDGIVPYDDDAAGVGTSFRATSEQEGDFCCYLKPGQAIESIFMGAVEQFLSKCSQRETLETFELQVIEAAKVIRKFQVVFDSPLSARWKIHETGSEFVNPTSVVQDPIRD